jgi:uncharacterized delta-60 repeat protein
MKTLFTFLFFGLIITDCFSQAGAPDNTFGTNGKLYLSGFGFSSTGNGIAIQADGKIVVVGVNYDFTKTNFAVVRFNTDGTLDPTFNGTGKVTTGLSIGQDTATSVAIQSDGKIVVGGYTSVVTNGAETKDFAIARYNTDGSLDNTFDGDGKVTTDLSSLDHIYALAIQNDGKIVVAGSVRSNGSGLDFAVARYNTNGSLDNTFDVDGSLSTPITALNDEALALLIQADGRIVLAGYSSTSNLGPGPQNITLVRYTASGILDNTFDNDGIVTTFIDPTQAQGSIAASISAQADGKIVVAGRFANDPGGYMTVVRYNTNGSLDNTFDTDGKLTTLVGSFSEAKAVAIQNDGKIVIAGHTGKSLNSDLAVVRYNTLGSLDNSFDADGIAVLDVGGGGDEGNAMRLAGSRIYVAGTATISGVSHLALAAFKNDATALPISLTSFTAVKQVTSVELKWKTDGEYYTSYEVERSVDGRNFITVGTVNAAINNSFEKSYSFSDDLSVVNSESKTIFYRLKMIDASKFSYSQTIVVNRNGIVSSLQLILNPVKDILHLQATGANETAQLRITDAVGRVVRLEKVQLNNVTSVSINVQSLARGNYYLILQTNDRTQALPFLKQ